MLVCRDFCLGVGKELCDNSRKTTFSPISILKKINSLSEGVTRIPSVLIALEPVEQLPVLEFMVPLLIHARAKPRIVTQWWLK